MDWKPLEVHKGQGHLGGTGFLLEDGRGGLVLTEKIQAGFHDLIVQMAEVRQLFYVFLLDGALELGDEG